MNEAWPTELDFESWEEGPGPPPLFAIPPPPFPPGLFCDENADPWLAWKNDENTCVSLRGMDAQIGDLGSPALVASLGTLSGAIFITIAAFIAWRRWRNVKSYGRKPTAGRSLSYEWDKEDVLPPLLMDSPWLQERGSRGSGRSLKTTRSARDSQRSRHASEKSGETSLSDGIYSEIPSDSGRGVSPYQPTTYQIRHNRRPYTYQLASTDSPTRLIPACSPRNVHYHPVPVHIKHVHCNCHPSENPYESPYSYARSCGESIRALKPDYECHYSQYSGASRIYRGRCPPEPPPRFVESIALPDDSRMRTLDRPARTVVDSMAVLGDSRVRILDRPTRTVVLNSLRSGTLDDSGNKSESCDESDVNESL